jgi:hypothetical protein
LLTEPLAIELLIAERSTGLGLTPVALVRKAGFKNVTKGLRRLEQLCIGDFAHAQGLVERLPATLEVSALVLAEVVAETRQQIRAAEETEYRSNFKPHAILLTERSIPSQIVVAAIIGAHRLLTIELDEARCRSSYCRQVLAIMNQRKSGATDYFIPTFGKVTGFVVNYTPTQAMTFDTEGRALAILPKAVRQGDATLTMGARPIHSGPN